VIYIVGQNYASSERYARENFISSDNWTHVATEEALRGVRIGPDVNVDVVFCNGWYNRGDIDKIIDIYSARYINAKMNQPKHTQFTIDIETDSDDVMEFFRKLNED